MAALSNKRHERFCNEYLSDLNGTAAYRRSGYSASNANVASCNLLGRADIQARIAELQQDRQERTQIDGDRVVEELAKIAFSNITDVVNTARGSVIISSTQDLDESVQAAIHTISETKHGVTIRMHSKTQALEMLGRYLGLFSDINVAIATLAKYGINLKRTESGWRIDDAPSP